jgi:hypothetical protein
LVLLLLTGIYINTTYDLLIFPEAKQATAQLPAFSDEVPAGATNDIGQNGGFTVPFVGNDHRSVSG